MGHLTRHVYVMWDILRNENCNQIQFVTTHIILYDVLCDNRLFCVISYLTLQIIRMCCALQHITDIKLFGYWHNQMSDARYLCHLREQTRTSSVPPDTRNRHKERVEQM